jgi:protein-S-isoprenylcysteine O-methyltransferase Ste14
MMGNLKKLKELAPSTRRNAWRRGAQMIFFYTLIAVILFVSAGTYHWLYAWIYAGMMYLFMFVGAFFMPLELIAERGSRKVNTEKRDQVVTTLIQPAFLALCLISGLDFRWKWSGESSFGWHAIGGIIFLFGCTLEIWAMLVNPFFSSTVRIQFKRGHSVCSSVPYKIVRHPEYVGIILYFGFTPLFLGSLWAFIPAAVIAIVLVIRTVLEDKTLQSKLPGYREYAAQVKYRILPGIW